jgi:hypothetical protein
VQAALDPVLSTHYAPAYELDLGQTLAPLRRGSGDPAYRADSSGIWRTQRTPHGDPDSPSVGDYHLPALVGWALIGTPVDDDGMLALLEPYRGHRQRVMRLITASGFTKPKFGPRMTIQDHRLN